MRRLLLCLTLAGAGSLLAACGDSTSPARDARPGVRGTAVAPPRDQVTGDLNAIYPSGGVGTAANAQLTNVFRSIDGGKAVAARQQAAALCEFTLKQQAAGRLHAPDVNTLLADAVNSLCDELYLTVGLGPGGIDVSGQDAVAQFIPACQPAEVRLPNGQALVRWPGTGANGCTYDQDVTVVITPIDYHAYDPTKGPLTTTQNQWPFFYDITVVPLIQPKNPATVGICTLEEAPAGDEAYVAPEVVHGNLRIGHNRSASAPGGAGFEVLPLVTLTNADLPCIPPAGTAFNFGDSVRERGLAYALGGAAHVVARQAIKVLTPTPAYAGHGGLGGLTSSFSPFGAVETQPAPPPPTTAYVVEPNPVFYPGNPVQMSVGAVSLAAQLPTCTPEPGSWSSSNSSVAAIDAATGVLTPASLGTTNVTVYCSTSSGRYTVTTAIGVTSPIG